MEGQKEIASNESSPITLRTSYTSKGFKRVCFKVHLSTEWVVHDEIGLLLPAIFLPAIGGGDWCLVSAVT